MEFPTTRWSLLVHATLHGERPAEASAALADFCRRYREPVVAFVRRHGWEAHEAEDVAHDFLVHVLEHGTLRRADAARGRFRSFLLGALGRFLGDVRDRRDALKRGGGVVTVPLAMTGGAAREASADAAGNDAREPAAVDVAATDAALAAEAFDRGWAEQLLTAALARLEADYTEKGRGAEWAVLRAFVPGAVATPAYDEAAAQLGIGLGTLKTEVHRLRQRLRAALRAEVAATVSEPPEIEAEIVYLGRVLRAAAERG